MLSHVPPGQAGACPMQACMEQARLAYLPPSMPRAVRRTTLSLEMRTGDRAPMTWHAILPTRRRQTQPSTSRQLCDDCGYRGRSSCEPTWQLSKGLRSASSHGGVNGQISALVPSLTRIGWDVTSASAWVTDNGTVNRLLWTSPRVATPLL